MTIRARFTLLLGSLIAVLLLALLGLGALKQTRRDFVITADRQARAMTLNHWIDAANRELLQIAGDLATADGIATAVRSEDAGWLQRTLATHGPSARLNALWIVRADGSTVLQAALSPGLPGNPPLRLGELARLIAETPSPRFFAEASGEFIELCARPIRATGSGHWLLAARRWDESLLQSLAALTESNVSLRPAHEAAQPPPHDQNLVLLRPLADASGRTLRMLRLDYALPGLEHAIGSDWQQTLLFVAFGLLLLAGVTLALRRWVLRPLAAIGESLAVGQGTPVATLTTDRGELGRVARLVVSSFEQRAALEQEIADRARAQEALDRSERELRALIADRTRLGRDLHDGVIQSLYAAGMNLARIRAQLAPAQSEAAARVEQTSNMLNESIQDLRNFIEGLEPEALKTRSFSEAIGDLMQAMGNLRAFQSSMDLDEQVAAQLTLSQRVHALQITREAVSNALRHGQANRIEIALRQRGGLAEFKIIDNGSGFDASSPSSAGKGLLNFSERARELDAVLTVDSHPGRGTIVVLTFSLP
ncbi:MAG: histidine kinase [Opitutaceae bacterium]|nr:histidine kinase [Opitutaceae bacterium]